MDYEALTRGFIVASVAVWVVYDVAIIILGGTRASESVQIRKWSRYPLIPFGVGVVMGHWFWCSCG